MNKPEYNARRALALGSLAAVLLFASRLGSVADAVEREAFRGQWAEKVRTVNMMIGQLDWYVERDNDWDKYDYAADLRREVYDLDAWPGVYAALFDSDFNLLSDRWASDEECGFEPIQNHSVRMAALDQEYGELTAPCDSDAGMASEMVVFFSWVPSGPGYDNRLLVVVSMRPENRDSNPAGPLVGWCAGLVAVAGGSIIAVALASRPPPEQPRANKEGGTSA